MNVLWKSLAVGVAINAVVAACGGAPPADEITRTPIEVTVAPAALVDSTERLEAGGIIAARENASVASRMVATVASIAVRAGDRVRAGDVLVILDAHEVADLAQQARATALAAEKSVAHAQAALVAAEAEQQLASAWHTRIAALHARQSATTHERDTAASRLAVAEARVTQARAAIDAGVAELDAARAGVGAATATAGYTTLRAPFDGVITERLTDPGNLVTPGAPLLRLDADGERQVLARVDAARAVYVHPADVVDVEIDGDGGSDRPDQTIRGAVAEVNRAIDQSQRTFLVKVRVPPTVTARSGTFVRVVFRGAARRGLVVPLETIRRSGQVSSVYVVENGIARLRLVHEGVRSATGVEILAGLEPGELVATSSVDRLADGTTVVIRPARAHGEGMP